MLIDPPRPSQAIAPSDLPQFERGGYWLQLKLNGAYNIFMVSELGVQTVKRDGLAHKIWSLTNQTLKFFKALPPGIYVAELLHNRGLRDTHYLHDVLAFQGKPLIGCPYKDRYQILYETLLQHPMKQTVGMSLGYITIRPNIWLARNHKSGFKEIFDSLTGKINEGVVLKQPTARLSFTNNSDGWAIKCRRPNGNSAF